jgi:GNAT superfamily N-acetyltransferase
MSDYTLTLVTDTDANPEDLRAIGAPLSEYNRKMMPGSNFKRLDIVVRNAEGEVVGGLRGETYWDWLYVDILGLREEARGQDIGTQLLAMAEQEAVARGCHSAYLDTFSFQALPFYQKQGYEIFGALDNYPGEHKRYFLCKRLIEGSGTGSAPGIQIPEHPNT